MVKLRGLKQIQRAAYGAEIRAQIALLVKQMREAGPDTWWWLITMVEKQRALAEGQQQHTQDILNTFARILELHLEAGEHILPDKRAEWLVAQDADAFNDMHIAVAMSNELLATVNELRMASPDERGQVLHKVYMLGADPSHFSMALLPASGYVAGGGVE